MAAEEKLVSLLSGCITEGEYIPVPLIAAVTDGPEFINNPPCSDIWVGHQHYH